MKTLYLLRHAKSSWSDATLTDRERPLNKRGRSAATAMGRYIDREGLVPDLVLCSSATRTHETLERISAGWSPQPTVRIEDNLYDFSAGGSYLSLIRNTDSDVGRLMLIGHNPTMEMLAAHLTGGGDPDALQRMDLKYPTCALAEFHFDLKSWTGVREAGGTLKRFIVPRELSD